jgi:two-component system chemotaxis response regulator CheY
VKIKFLIVDDSVVMRKMIIQTIYSGGTFTPDNSEMLQASDGAQGLEIFKTQSPQIVLTDWIMPNMDGYEMIKKMREIDTKVPIILITIVTQDTDERLKGLLSEKAVTDYIIKPLRTGILEEKLVKAFQALAG